MLTIEIKRNGELIGGAKVRNISDLAGISDYEVVAAESAAPDLGVEQDFREDFVIPSHMRDQSVWALVHRISREAFRLQKKNGHAQADYPVRAKGAARVE